MKTWLVTGATSDIVVAICRRLASGNRFVLVGRSEERLNHVADDLRSRGALFVAVSLFDFEDYQLWDVHFSDIIDSHGKPDNVIIGQGVMLDSGEADKDLNTSLAMVAINTLSCMAVLTSASQSITPDRGFILVLGSVAGDRGRASNYLYGASKAALETVVSGISLNRQNANITYLLVKPGQTRTSMTRHLHTDGFLWSDADDVARAVCSRIEKGKGGVLYTPWYWHPIMLVIRMLPNFVLRYLQI
jgi:short-subunit dehydrogenase